MDRVRGHCTSFHVWKAKSEQRREHRPSARFTVVREEDSEWTSTAPPTTASTTCRTSTFQPHYVEQDGLRMHYLDEGEGDAGAAAARRADVVVPLPQDDPAADGRSRAASRPTTSASGARTSRQTRELVLVRQPRRLDRASRRGARPARRHARRSGLGRPDRLPLRRRAPRPRRAARRHEHRHRRPRAERGVAALPGVHAPSRPRHRCRTAPPAVARAAGRATT